METLGGRVLCNHGPAAAFALRLRRARKAGHYASRGPAAAFAVRLRRAKEAGQYVRIELRGVRTPYRVEASAHQTEMTAVGLEHALLRTGRFPRQRIVGEPENESGREDRRRASRTNSHALPSSQTPGVRSLMGTCDECVSPPPVVQSEGSARVLPVCYLRLPLLTAARTRGAGGLITAPSQCSTSLPFRTRNVSNVKTS